jgi:hypothetical protein
MTWTDECLDGNFRLLRADISRLDSKLDATAEAIRGEISALKNALIVCAFGVVAAIVGSSAL